MAAKLYISFRRNDFRYFDPPFGVLFNFPSRYLFAIDFQMIFRFLRRMPQLRTSLSRNTTRMLRDSYYFDRQPRSYHPLWRTIPSNLATVEKRISLTHTFCNLRYDLIPFRSPLMGESLLIFIPRFNNMLKFDRLLTLTPA